MMMDTSYFYSDSSFFNEPIIKPNIITGEGRMRFRRSSWLDKRPDQKKKSRRKIAKKSKRVNRR